VAGPHGGTAYRLPGDSGFAELVNEPEAADARAASKTALVVYFLEKDGKSPLSPPPADVGLELMVDRHWVKVPLTGQPKAGDDAGAARFATAPGPYALAETHGTLKATVAGQPATIEFAAGR
jgi:hypothetical protein